MEGPMSLEALCALSVACFAAALAVALATPTRLPAPARPPAISARQARNRRVVPNPRASTGASDGTPPPAPTRRSVLNPRRTEPAEPVVDQRAEPAVDQRAEPVVGKGPFLKSAGDAVFTPLAPVAPPPGQEPCPPGGGQALAERVARDMGSRSREPNLRHLYRRGLNRLAEAHEREFLQHARRDPSLRPIRADST